MVRPRSISAYPGPVRQPTKGSAIARLLRDTRVLVDRLWPRGLTKAKAGLDEWCKEVAPSTELRKWYGHDPDRFPEFRRRYRSELSGAEHTATLAHLREVAGGGTLTLLTASKDVAISEAAVLAELIEEGLR